MSQVAAPYRLDASRVFYASTQYYAMAAAGRTTMTAALVDSPLTTGNDLDGMVVWIAARKAGRNAEVVKLTAGQSVDVTDGGVTEQPPPPGCGCGMGSSPLLLLALALALRLRSGRWRIDA